jgi:hypothetical protein
MRNRTKPRVHENSDHVTVSEATPVAIQFPEQLQRTTEITENCAGTPQKVRDKKRCIQNKCALFVFRVLHFSASACAIHQRNCHLHSSKDTSCLRVRGFLNRGEPKGSF